IRVSSISSIASSNVIVSPRGITIHYFTSFKQPVLIYNAFALPQFGASLCTGTGAQLGKA
ncbi:MAG: hypothetical protein M0P01_07225, partial [Treponema sp.]|nr:hypothetical protein [Treponema sp.]